MTVTGDKKGNKSNRFTGRGCSLIGEWTIWCQPLPHNEVIVNIYIEKLQAVEGPGVHNWWWFRRRLFQSGRHDQNWGVNSWGFSCFVILSKTLEYSDTTSLLSEISHLFPLRGSWDVGQQSGPEFYTRAPVPVSFMVWSWTVRLTC